MSTRTFTFQVTAPPPSGIPAHIANAPVGEWTAIGSNTMADVKYSYTNWNVSGFISNLQGIMNAWSGAAYDPVVHKLYVHGGGHNDYDGNDSFAFDLASNTWARLDNPSPFDDNTYAAANPGWTGTFPDNGPQPIHTYQIMEVNPNTGKIYYLGRGGSNHTKIREFTPALATQQTPGAFRNAWAYKATMTYPDPSGAASVWMSDEQKFLVCYHDPGTWINLVRYDPATDTIGPIMGTGVYWSGDKSIAYSPTRRLAIVHRSALSTNTLVMFNAATNAWSSQAVTGATLPNRCTLKYDSVRDRFIAYTDEWADRRVLFSINPDTWVATQINPSGTVPPAMPTSFHNGIHGRFQYCADYDVYLMVNSVTANVYLYKPSGWSPPGA